MTCLFTTKIRNMSVSTPGTGKAPMRTQMCHGDLVLKMYYVCYELLYFGGLAGA